MAIQTQLTDGQAVPKAGFSLIEMSIVVVIIGLIIGSIAVAKTMIRQAHLQSAIGEYGRYVQAIKEFQDRYLALPGDMNNAENMWGTDPGGCPAAINTVPLVATCNGDGNGTIGSSDTSGNVSKQTEWYRAWQQLADAGFINGAFTGTSDAHGSAVIALSVPESNLRESGWTFFYYLQNADNPTLWGDHYGHLLSFGQYTSGDIARTPNLTAAEAFEIDSKIDDGKPGRGIMRARRTAVEPNCTTNDTAQDAATYNMASSGTRWSGGFACSPIFILGF